MNPKKKEGDVQIKRVLSNAGQSAYFDPFSLYASFPFGVSDANKNTELAPVFVHEYTHYIQTVSTVYGLNRLMLWLRMILLLNEYFKAGQELKIPLSVWREQNDLPEVFKHLDLCFEEKLLLDYLENPHVYELDSNGSSLASVVSAEYDFFKDGEPHTMMMRTHKEGDSYFGIPIAGRSVQEGMAYAIEKKWSTRESVVEESSSDVRMHFYSAIPLMCSTLANDKLDRFEIAAVLCDLSLMSPQPGMMFSHLFNSAQEYLVSGKNVSIESLYNFLFEVTMEISNEDITSLLASYDGIERDIQRVGSNVVRDSILLLIQTARKLLDHRMTDPFKIVRALTSPNSEEIKNLMKEFPLPIYRVGNKWKTHHNNPELQNMGFVNLFFTHIINSYLFKEKHVTCPLHDSPNCDSPKTENCLISPWKLAPDDKNDICLYGLMLDAVNIRGKIVETVA